MYSEGNMPPKKTVLKWDGNYDGKNANIHMNLDVDGKKRNSSLKLTNDELMKILGANVVAKPIDERLQSLDEDISKMYVSPTNYPMIIMSPSHSPSPYQQQPMPMMVPLMHSPQNVPVFIDDMPEEMPR
jgi:hypothetical protein